MSNTAMNTSSDQLTDRQRIMSEALAHAKALDQSRAAYSASSGRQTMGSLNSVRDQPSDYEIRERAVAVALQAASATGCEVMPLAKEVYDWLKAAE